MAGDLNLKDAVGDDVGGESAEALSAAAPHAHQQHVASGLANDAHHTAD